jgi:hypothetical protein
MFITVVGSRRSISEKSLQTLLHTGLIKHSSHRQLFNDDIPDLVKQHSGLFFI